jgi:hypothetical protein
MLLWRPRRDLGSTGMPVSSAKLSQELKVQYINNLPLTQQPLLACFPNSVLTKDVKIGVYASADSMSVSVSDHIFRQNSWAKQHAMWLVRTAPE